MQNKVNFSMMQVLHEMYILWLVADYWQASYLDGIAKRHKATHRHIKHFSWKILECDLLNAVENMFQDFFFLPIKIEEGEGMQKKSQF